MRRRAGVGLHAAYGAPSAHRAAAVLPWLIEEACP